MVSSMNVITLSNSTFSSWPPSEASCTFFGCCVVLKFSEVLLDYSWVLASVLLLFCFCFSFFGDLDLLLERFEVKDWIFCCNVGLSPVVFVFWLILLDATFVLFFKILAYVSFRISCIVVVCDVFLFLSVSGLCFK